MKALFYALAVISLLFFVYSIVRLIPHAQQQVAADIGEIKGFEDVNNDDYTKLITHMKDRIKAAQDDASKNQSRYFWLSFLVTALTAASTLVSSIQAAKSQASQDPKRAQQFAIIIAILTFCSSLANFAATHFNERNNEATKISGDLITMRNQFSADYSKAAAADKPDIIRTYAQRVD